MSYSAKAIDAINTLIEVAQAQGDGDLWALSVVEENGEQATTVGIFAFESAAIDTRKALLPLFAQHNPGKKTMEVMRLTNVPLAVGPALPGLPLTESVMVPIPSRPSVVKPRRFIGRRRNG